MSGWRVLLVAMMLGCMGIGEACGDAPSPAVAYSTEARREITQLPAAPIVPGGVEDLKAIQARVEAVVKEALPATVAVLLEDGQGSGVIVSKEGYVLTAGHVSGRPGQSVTIVLANGKELHGKALGANNNIDSGMIKIIDKAPGKKGFPYVPLGSAKELKAGQWVVAMGHPGGYQEDRPPVVRLGRVLEASHQLLATDCPLINGDSGGPVFDLDGRLIGINSRIGMTMTTNVHVPIDTFEETWDRLAKGEEWGGTKGLLARFGLGGGGETIPADGAMLGIRGNDFEGGQGGAVVQRVKSGTPAEKAGLKAGDVVVSLDGKKIGGVDELAEKVNEHTPGDVVRLMVLRGEQRVELAVTLGAAK